MDEQPRPEMVWCGGINSGQDVSIRLVVNEIYQQETNLRSREPLAVLKVHSHQLKKCSEYFEKCLTRRWSEHATTPSLEFTLEMLQGQPVESYTDCFSRMYTPFRKDFKGVKYCLALLQVASQIEFMDLVKSVSRYLSIVQWSVEDELLIRQCSSAPDFSRSQAKELVARLELDGPSKEECRKKLCNLVEQCVGIAVGHDRPGCALSLDLARCLISDMLTGIGQNESVSAFAEDVVRIVSHQAKEALADFHEYCREHAEFRVLSTAGLPQLMDVARIVGFREKLDAVQWALEVMLKAHVAEDLIESFLQLEFYPIILAAAVCSESRDINLQALEFFKLMLFIHSEVAAANLLLGTPQRVALIDHWNLNYFLEGGNKCNILRKMGLSFARAVQTVFLGLPFEHQIGLLERHRFEYHKFICMGMHISMLTTKWPAEGMDA